MRLKEIRESNNFTQMELAKKLQVSRSVYGMWEQENDFIPLKRLIDFCNFFDVSLDYALGFSEETKYEDLKKDIDPIKLKERIKALRKEKNMTQLKLSSKLKITRSLISKYETGSNLILTGFLIEYVKYFHISADYLTGRIDTKINIRC